MDRPPQHRLFVIRDFSIKGGLRDTLVHLKDNPPAGYANITILDDGDVRFGSLARGHVFPGIEDATRGLAVVDKPNANVGFEIGFAYALGKDVALVGWGNERPNWLDASPLRGLIVHVASDDDRFRQILTAEKWHELGDISDAPSPKSGQGRCFFLCPSGGAGQGYNKLAVDLHPQWERLPNTRWNLADLPDLLVNVSDLIWLIAPVPEGSEERDGVENSANAVVAGYAFAMGIPLIVLRSNEAREVADVVHEAQVFKSYDDLKHILSSIPLKHKILPTSSSQNKMYKEAVKDRIHYPVSPLSSFPKTLSSGELKDSLPASVHFVGRDHNIEHVITMFGLKRPIVICAIAGMGKGTLALECAHRLLSGSRLPRQLLPIAERFKAYVWFSAPLDGTPLEPILDRIAETLEYEYILGLEKSKKQAQIYKLLSVVPTLIVVENADKMESDALDYFEALPSQTQMLVTACGMSELCKKRPWSIVDLQPLEDDDARRLVTYWDNESSLRLNNYSVNAIIDASKNVPLAIEWAVGLFARAGTHMRGKIIQSLTYHDHAYDPTDYVFKLAWEQLTVDAQRLLKSIVIVVDSTTAEAVKELAGFEDQERLLDTLNLLSDMHIITRADDGEVRYSVYPHAAYLIKKTMNQAELANFEVKFIDYFLEFVQSKAGRNGRGSLKVLRRERLNILRAIALCDKNMRDRDFVRFHRSTYHMLWVRGLWDTNLANGKRAVDYAKRLERFEEAAWIYMESLGWVEYCRGNYRSAEKYYGLAAEAIGNYEKKLRRDRDTITFNLDSKRSNDNSANSSRLLDPDLKARLKNYQGRLMTIKGDYKNALETLWEGLRYSEDDLTTGYIEGALGDLYFSRKQYNMAKTRYRAVRTLAEKGGDAFRKSSIVCDLADVAKALNDLEYAKTQFKEALGIATRERRLEVKARCNFGLGDIFLNEGKRNDARTHLVLSRGQFQMLGRERDVLRTQFLIDVLEKRVAQRNVHTDFESEDLHKGVDVLLINAPREAVPRAVGSCQDHRMPLGLMYISRFLKHRGLKVSLFDAETLSKGLNDIVREALDKNPRVVGLNCHTLNRRVVYEIVRTLYTVIPGLRIVLGGAHPSSDPQGTLEECGDLEGLVVIAGEGERAMYEVVSREADYKNVPGVWYLDAGNVISSNRYMPRIQNLDSLGFPDVDDVPVERFLEFEEEALEGMWHRVYLSASRGCRWSCAFCAEYPSWDKTETYRSADNVVEEMLAYRRSKHRIRRFYFYDDTFADWREWRKFCEKVENHNLYWSCSTRIDTLTPKNVELMARGGCKEIAIGLESGATHILEKMKKQWQENLNRKATAGTVVDEVGNRIALCHQKGIRVRTHFIFGYPWEGKSDISTTMRFARLLKQQYGLEDANFFVLKVYPGTKLEKDVGTLVAQTSLRDADIYDVWSVYDWEETKDSRLGKKANDQVKAKLRRFNDIPRVAIHPHLSSLALRQLVRNAYEIFFGDVPEERLEEWLWTGVAWKN